MNTLVPLKQSIMHNDFSNLSIQQLPSLVSGICTCGICFNGKINESLRINDMPVKNIVKVC